MWDGEEQLHSVVATARWISAVLPVERIALKKLAHLFEIGLLRRSVAHLFVELRSPSGPVVYVDGLLAGVFGSIDAVPIASRS